VSVLVPLYNHRRYIRACLDSVAGEDYPNLEIVIIDDGSTDGSHEVVEEWAAGMSNFEVTFLRRGNRGLSRTLNDLVEMAQGHYVAPIASDDKLVRGGIRARVEYLRQNPGKLAVFGDAIVIDPDDRQLLDSAISGLHGGDKSRLLRDDCRLDELVFRWCVPGPVLLASRELYSIVGPYDEQLIVEDFDFYLRMASKGLLGFVDLPVAAYRWHMNSISARIKTRPDREWLLMTARKNYSRLRGMPKYYLWAMHWRMTAQRSETGRRFAYWIPRAVEKALAGAYRRLLAPSAGAAGKPPRL
jgi:glycosyltransferase involved in cell wall biosynthesis